MPVYPPQLLEGEALFSAIARYGDEMQVANWPVFLKGLFGYSPRLHPALVQNLEQLAEQTKVCWEKTGDELAESTTLFPYISAFQDSETAETIKRAVLCGTGDLSLANAYLRSWPKVLRACPRCVAGDRIGGGVAFWRRVHQLPSVLVCEFHGVALSEYAYRHVWNMRWPTLEAMARTSAPPALLGLGFSPLWLEAARISRECLARDGMVTSVRAEVGASWIRSQFALKSVAGRAELRWSFEKAFGTEGLSCLGLRLAGNRDWLSGRMEGRYSAMASVVDVLIAAFCQSQRPRDYRLVWPRCVNPFADHGPDYAAGWIRLRAGRGHAACICGIQFSFPMAR
ncbi:Tn7-like transposition protein D [Paraburkholderia caribensis MBA4]|uniref:Tn7-like transposition protein D n=1 Tax=Paraburkholderia caribensis MBA4 TaxID=1323664 RepID=A0A0P0RIH8_9BURK|nr:Tn7-like transposition protein D [Paraburkholderia caribensis MBA4]